MSETVFSITRTSGRPGTRFVGKTGHKLKVGDPAVLVPRSQVDPQLVADVNASPAEFDSVPALPRDIATGADPVELAVNALSKTVNERDTDFDWEVDPVVGASGVTELELVVVCKDTDHANSPINHGLDGRRMALEITAGSAEFEEVGGGQGPKTYEIQNGRAIAKLVVAAALNEAQTVEMTDPDATGLTTPLDATVNFNA